MAVWEYERSKTGGERRSGGEPLPRNEGVPIWNDRDSADGLLLDQELVGDLAGVAFPRTQDGRREIRLVGRVGEGAGFEAERLLQTIAAAKIGETGDWRLSIVKRSDRAKGFVVLPKRWLVERAFSWLTRCRRLVRRYEQYFTTSVAFIRLAMIRLMLRRLDRK